MVGPGRAFYYTFEAGDAFFIVLDTGETYADLRRELERLIADNDKLWQMVGELTRQNGQLLAPIPALPPPPAEAPTSSTTITSPQPASSSTSISPKMSTTPGHWPCCTRWPTAVRRRSSA